MWVWLGNFWYCGFTAYIHELFELRGLRGKNSRENESKVEEASVQINSFSLLKTDLLWSQVIR